MCQNKEDKSDQDHVVSQRKGRRVELEHFDIEMVADQERVTEEEITINIKVISLIFIVTFISVVVFCLAIIFVMFRLGSKQSRTDKNIQCLPPTPTEHSSIVRPNTYILEPVAKQKKKEPIWTLQNKSIIKELGRGFYSKVYLAEDEKCGYIAIKTVDTKKTNKSEECIVNEIDILSKMKPHANIVKMIGFNMDEKLLVIEFCFHGNLRDYIIRNKKYFVDENDPETQDLDTNTYLCSSPGLSENIPMTDYLSSIQAKLDSPKDDESVKSRKSYLGTRRLLHWVYQVSSGLHHLGEEGIIHRDIALRNILLTSNDVVKIADLGLAVSSSSLPSPQYWSRSNKPTPYKWMAVESLAEGVFSLQSDIWAFGVLVWEIFSLGEDPYGEVNPIELTKMLQTGGRMGECSLAPHRVNQLIRSCWKADPAQRPSSEELKNILSLYNRDIMDSGAGYLDMTHTTTGYLELQPGYQEDQTTRTSYWTNYKIINGAPLCVDT